MTLSWVGFLTLAPSKISFILVRKRYKFPTGLIVCLIKPVEKIYSSLLAPSVQFSSVAQSCPTFCDPMNHSTPGLDVGASARNPTCDKVMQQRPDGQGESGLRVSPWYFLSMYPQNKNMPALLYCAFPLF